MVGPSEHGHVSTLASSHEIKAKDASLLSLLEAKDAMQSESFSPRVKSVVLHVSVRTSEGIF